MSKTVRQRKVLEADGSGAMLCVSGERSNLSYIGIEGCEQAATGGETKGQTGSYSFSTQENEYPCIHFPLRQNVSAPA
jgi:hypothetical protein